MFTALKDMKTYSEALDLYKNRVGGQSLSRAPASGRGSSSSRKQKIHQRMEALRVPDLFSLFDDEKPSPTSQTVITTLELAAKVVRSGRNVCFHGFGDKTLLVSQTFTTFSDSFTVIKINGAQTELTPRSLFACVLKLVEKKVNEEGLAYNYSADREVGKIAKNAYFLLKKLRKNSFLLLFSALDNWCFLRPSAFEALALLASLPNFRVVGCVDSVNFPVMTSRVAFHNFSFVFFALHTYVPYTTQLQYIDTLAHPKHEKRSPQVVQSILNTLTPNQRELVLFALSEIALSAKGAVEEPELFNKALWEAKATSYAQFVENLKEAFLHNVLLKRKGEGGATAYRTALSPHVLEIVLRAPAAGAKARRGARGAPPTS